MTLESRDVDMQVRAALLRISYEGLPQFLVLSMAVPVLFHWLLLPMFDRGVVGAWQKARWSARLLRGALGAADHLLKPADADRLIGAVQSAASRRNLTGTTSPLMATV